MSETPEEVVDRALRLLTPAEPTLKRKHQTVNVVIALRAAGMLPPRGTSEPSGNPGQLDVQVKRAAEALRQEEGFMETVDSALEITWSEYIAHLVLTAAGVTSQPVVDVDKLADAIGKSYQNSQGLKIRDDMRTARAVVAWLKGGAR